MTDGPAPSAPRTDPLRMSKMQVARLVARGGDADAALSGIDRDIEAGSPQNADGTINVVEYVAWLVKNAGRRA